MGESRESDYGINLYLAFEELQEFSGEEFIKNIMQSGNLSLYRPKKYSLEDFDFCKKEHFTEIEEIFRKAGLINTDFFDNANGFSDIEKLFIAYKMNFPVNIQGFLNLSSAKRSETVKRLMLIDELVNEQNLCLQDADLREKLEIIYNKTKQYRNENGALNPLEVLILAEGATEETLLPVFSELAGIDFNKNGIKIISSGGKNQMLKLYAKLSREINLPILMIFDSDGYEEAESIKNSLRGKDDIYIIPKGEFEDILPDSLICRAVNLHYRLTGKINLSDIKDAEKKSRVLYCLWKEKGFGEFKKAEFARIIAKNIARETDLSEELKIIFEKIREKI